MTTTHAQKLLSTMLFTLLSLSPGLPICYLSRGYLQPLLDVSGVFSPPVHQKGVTLC